MTRFTDPTVVGKKFYFVNEVVEYKLTRYVWTACTDVALRDSIMEHATELIRQIIRKQGLHTIYPGKDEASFGDLLQTAWCQIERTLYKYKATPHCRKCYNYNRPMKSALYIPSEYEYGILTMDEVIKLHGSCPNCNTKLSKTPAVEPQQGISGGSETILYRGMSKVFNMWSQISRTVILAHIKKEGRDRRNSDSYKSYVGGKSKSSDIIINRFLSEARTVCAYNDAYLEIIDALEYIILNDDKPHDSMIRKLSDKSGHSKSTVAEFMKYLKLRSFEFTDSPISRSLSGRSAIRSEKVSDYDADEI